MPRPRIGLLPLYIELYDQSLPEMRDRVEAFYATIVSEMEKRGVDVTTAPVCRLKKEFVAAIKSFEDAQADAIVTLHLAYSPSLESSEALAATKLPIIVLDTTPSHSFGPDQDPGEILYNHGIHGVQDMCNLLIRNRKPYQIEAGHWERSDVLDRVAGWARAASLAASMRSARVGLIGEVFVGMGDFAVPKGVMRSTIGIETVPFDPKVMRSLLPGAADKEVEAEMAADLARYATDGLDPDAHRRTVRTSLAVRRWIEKEQLTAFTFNFLAVDRTSGIPTAPFLEASKAMSRGLGYAGEGDVLTAALVGSLASFYPATTFTEMFCPDWAGNSIFLSHMGEMNLDLAAETPRLTVKPFPWTDAEDPVVGVARLRGGKGVLVNLAPGPDDAYTLVVARVTMLEVEGQDKMADWVHGWFKPGMPIDDFLAAYSHVGGTHHSALVYGDVIEDLVRFGTIMGWDVIVLEAESNQ